MPNDSLTREIMGNIGAFSQFLFYLLATAAIACFSYGLHRRTRLWRLGRQTDQPLNWRASITRFMTHVMTQRTLQRGRRAAGIAHRLFFYGFIVLLIGTILVAIEHYGALLMGRPAHQPLFHKGLYFACYELVLDTFGLAMLAGICWFIQRRWRGRSSMAHHWSDWVILFSLLLLGISGYLVEGLRIIDAQTPQPGYSYVGLAAATVFRQFGIDSSQASGIHLALWWIHAVLALGFIAAFPYTRLLHSLAGKWLISTRNEPLGIMIPIAIEEVESTGRVGVERIGDFTRQQLIELDACVSCGRCQDACPAHAAGKPLSPRNVVQDLRGHLNIVGPLLLAGQEEAGLESIHGKTISAETLWSCTSCHACVDTCPLDVNPLRMITDMRRHLVGESQLRGAPATALQKMQRSGNPWGLPAEERLHWAAGLHVPTVEENPEFEILYWVGCAASYDRRIQRVARAVVQLLQYAQVNFAVLGPEERCTGESARRMGDEFLFQEMAAGNLETLQRHAVRKIITHCPHCLNSLTNDYSQFGGDFEVVHHSQFLQELVQQGQLVLADQEPGQAAEITYHDPCYLARVQQISDPPRQIIELTLPTGNHLREMPRRRENTGCCGAGGGRMWFDDPPEQRAGMDRIAEIKATGAHTVAVGCPFCLTMVRDGLAAENIEIEVQDIAEVLLATVTAPPIMDGPAA